MLKKLIVPALLATLFACATFLQQKRVSALREERDAYRGTCETLLAQVDHYKTENGLNVAKTGEMRLSLAEFERSHAEDAALIAHLKLRVGGIERITASQTRTVYEVRERGRDSVRVENPSPGDGNPAEYPLAEGVSPVIDTLLCVDYHTEWFDFCGCFDSERNFEGTVESRDRLIYVEHVTRARFLGFLWRTRRVLRREQQIVSQNPDTRIMHARFVTIRR